MRLIKVTLSAMLLTFMLNNISLSQPPPVGSISGVVMETDSITPIPGAIVQATVQDTTITFTDTTDLAGQYLFPDMQLELYDVVASKDYYVTQVQNDVQVFMDQVTVVDFYLERQLCPYMPGDANGSGAFNGLDVTFMVAYFKGGPNPAIDCHPYCPNQPDPFYAAMDVNGDCVVNGLDISYFVSFLKGWWWNIRYCPDCPPAGL
jgi:hypothetical protein